MVGKLLCPFKQQTTLASELFVASATACQYSKHHFYNKQNNAPSLPLSLSLFHSSSTFSFSVFPLSSLLF